MSTCIEKEAEGVGARVREREGQCHLDSVEIYGNNFGV